MRKCVCVCVCVCLGLHRMLYGLLCFALLRCLLCIRVRNFSRVAVIMPLLSLLLLLTALLVCWCRSVSLSVYVYVCVCVGVGTRAFLRCYICFIFFGGWLGCFNFTADYFPLSLCSLFFLLPFCLCTLRFVVFGYMSLP